MTYYSRRAAGDEEWRRRQVEGALVRERARREADPEGHRARGREVSRRSRERQAKQGRTLHQLAKRIRAEPEELGRILREDVERGVVVYDAPSRRYSLNGGLPDDVKLALRELSL